MTTLFVIHETGRSLSLMEIARKLVAQNPQEKIIFLAIGDAANNCLLQMEDTDSLRRAELKRYASFFSAEGLRLFSDAEIKHLEDHPLTSDQLQIINSYLMSLRPDTIIIGSPSWLNALAPIQIAEAIADRVTPSTGFIYDGDFYKEDGCVYWKTLEKPNTPEFAWRKKFTWLASLPGSKKLIPEYDPPLALQVEVVGDPSIDKAINVMPLSKEVRAIIREELTVQDNQELLLVAGSKNIVDDKELVIELLKQNLDASFQIRILLHRGTKDYNEHIATYLNIFKDYPSSNIKIVAIPAMKNRIDNEYLANNFLILSNHTAERISAIADRLCSTIPGTQATQAAISGIPVYCSLRQHISYLPAGRINVGEQGLREFVIKDRVKLSALTKANLGLPKEATADIVCAIISSNKSHVYGSAQDPTLFANLATESSTRQASTASNPFPGNKPSPT